MILLFGLSMAFAGILTFWLYKALQLYYYTTKYEDPLTKVRYFMREVGDINVFLTIFIPLSVIFFFLLTRRYATYFHTISNGIHQLASGNFDNPVAINSKDEFGDIARDINLASKKLEQAVERGDFAENSKEQLVLNLAHDLRTPLTSVLGYLSFILKDNDLTAEQVRQYTQIAYSKSQRLEQLIEQLFEITRMNYGKFDLEKNTIALSELLIQLNEELYPVFEKNGLTSRLHVQPGVLLQGDGDMLARVFENLLTNAAHYGHAGEYIDIFCRATGREITVQVINYGAVIPAEELPHIFEMFYTGDQSRSCHEGSTGLGLFIAKKIVEQHQGTITAYSDESYTMFEVRFTKE